MAFLSLPLFTTSVFWLFFLFNFFLCLRVYIKNALKAVLVVGTPRSHFRWQLLVAASSHFWKPARTFPRIITSSSSFFPFGLTTNFGAGNIIREKHLHFQRSVTMEVSNTSIQKTTEDLEQCCIFFFWSCKSSVMSLIYWTPLFWHFVAEGTQWDPVRLDLSRLQWDCGHTWPDILFR